MMNEDAIKVRMQELEQQRRQLQANLFAVDGAIQDCEYWLSKLAEPEARSQVMAD